MVSAQSKKKTKAKQRYLKVKKDRRKKRKAAEAFHKTSVKGKVKEKQGEVKAKRKRNGDEKESSSEPSAEEDVSSLDEESSVSSRSVSKSILEIIPVQDEPKEPPRKKRKVSSELESSSSDEDTMSVAEEPQPLRRPSPPTSALPSFEMPAAENIASLEELALQGLDPGLLCAEIVDSARTMSIDTLPSESLSSKTRRRLKDLGIAELFAVQTALLPFLLPPSPKDRALYMPYNPPRDVCVSAPTGSGKTLAYVIPILELLSTRIVTRLRALIVLPTRDLVTQVRETFEALCKGRGLKIGSATGQHSFVHEQAQLVEQSDLPLDGGSSKVDILICTPGRLMDHLKGTRNFTLQHLRFLVIDEADRLLAQSFQDWLAQILEATRPAPNLSLVNASSTIINGFPHHDAVSPAWQCYPPWRSHIDEQKESSCQKLLFSATLTRDPARIAALELREAKYFIISDAAAKEGRHLVGGETFAFPATLTEHMIVCSSYKKPLMLFYLVQKHGVSNALVFTKSTESTNRLVKLFETFQDVLGEMANRPVVHAYSSDLSLAERKTILEKFKAREITILICSDLISRGIDISHVSHVISYDAPVDMRKYVHRVGRTARAGRSGDAWSLIEEQEARHFKKLMTDADHMDKIKKMKVSDKELEELNEKYEVAMKTYGSKPKAVVTSKV